MIPKKMCSIIKEQTLLETLKKNALGCKKNNAGNERIKSVFEVLTGLLWL